MGTADYLWTVKNIVPFLKIDKGLADEADGVQLMVHRGHAYIGHIFSKGFSVVDVRDPTKPNFQSSLRGVGKPRSSNRKNSPANVG